MQGLKIKNVTGRGTLALDLQDILAVVGQAAVHSESWWQVFSKDDGLLARIARSFSDIEFLEDPLKSIMRTWPQGGPRGASLSLTSRG